MNNESRPTILLIPGHWLGAWAWDEVVAHLDDGWRVLPMTLPGLDETDPARSSRTLEEQAAAIRRTIEAESAEGRTVLVVAHSGANAPVSVVLDQRPELVGRVVWVDSGPVAPGTVFAPDAAIDELPLPPFDQLGARASLEGLDTEALERFRAREVPQPGPVLRHPVELSNDARLAVPTTLVCCSMPSAQIKELVAAGHPMFSEVAHLEDVEYVDLPTGHWPMWSRPQELAGVIAAAASGRSGD